MVLPERHSSGSSTPYGAKHTKGTNVYKTCYSGAWGSDGELSTHPSLKAAIQACAASGDIVRDVEGKVIYQHDGMLQAITGHMVGSVYFCAYWRETYKVLAAHPNGSVTVEWYGDGRCANPRESRIGNHFTQLDRKDQLVEDFRMWTDRPPVKQTYFEH